jgi:hypothetical protein
MGYNWSEGEVLFSSLQYLAQPSKVSARFLWRYCHRAFGLSHKQKESHLIRFLEKANLWSQVDRSHLGEGYPGFQ